MDSISLLGPPPQSSRPLNQEDFDSKFNYVKYRKKRTNCEIFKTVFLKENFRHYQKAADFLPFVTWIQKYNVKSMGVRDLLGSLTMAALLLPQGIANGVLLEDLNAGLLSLILPQFVYLFLGSARHNTIGSISYTSFLVYCCKYYSQADLSTLGFYCGIFQLLLFVLPLDFVFGFLSSSLLMGFSLGIFLRIIIHFIPHFIVFRHQECDGHFRKMCFSAIAPCLQSHDIVLVAVLSSILILLVFRCKLHSLIVSKISFIIPYELIVLILLSLVALILDMNGKLKVTDFHLRVPPPRLSAWPNSFSQLFDSLAIALFSVSTHINITRSIAIEKMHFVHRKQELLCFSVVSMLSSVFSLLPPSSSHGNSQINVESAKYSLMSNLIAAGWLIIFIYFGSPLIKYVPVLECSVAMIFILNCYGIKEDFLTLRQLCSSSCWDATLAILALLCVLLIPNSCKGFLIALGISVTAVALKVQLSRPQVLVRVSENHLGEENRYEGEFLDTPVRILRLSSPIIYANCEAIRHELYRQATVVKGLIGIGIGSRTVSLRSQEPKKDSLARSSNNLTNIVITQDCELPQIPVPEGPTLRFIILGCSGIESVDRDGIQMLAQTYCDLNNDHIKLFLAGVPAKVRDSFEINNFYARVPKSVFFPTIQEALNAARVLVLPFHTSVSMNGCRDVIAFSNANSNLELYRISPEAV